MDEISKNNLIGVKLSALIAKNNINQTDVANAIGVSRVTVSAWKNGTRRPDKVNARKLEKYFGEEKGSFDVDEEDSMDDQGKVTVNENTYDIISYKIAAGYFDVIKTLADLVKEGKISEDSFNKAMEKLDK